MLTRTSKTWRIAEGLLKGILGFLFPQSAEVEFLENTTVESFLKRVPYAEKNLPSIISLFDYRNPLVKTLVWQIKFKNNRKLAKLAGKLMHEHLLHEIADLSLFQGGATPLLLPVPLARGRLRERGFNQCERIAEEIAQLDDEKYFFVSHAVTRVRETKSQAKSQGRHERMKNLKGAFQIQTPKEVRGHPIIILDDVTTTGATIGEIRKVLLEAGASSVTGLTLAH